VDDFGISLDVERDMKVSNESNKSMQKYKNFNRNIVKDEESVKYQVILMT
jgi:hypothetical protein